MKQYGAMSTILSIQSSVAYGHAGNSSAVFPMQRLGADVIAVHTVHFSNHTGYGSWRGPLLSPTDVASVIQGVDERGVLSEVDAVLSGYQGAAAMAEVILQAVALTKQRNPNAIYCCDPVMGDVGRGMYVLPGIPEYLRDQVLPHADILTPNQFELNFLAGRDATPTLESLLAAIDLIRSKGPKVVLVTSVDVAEFAENTLTMVAVSQAGAWQVTTPLLARTFTGSGDFTTATFLVSYLKNGDVATSLAETAAIVYSVLEKTTVSDKQELQLVAAQEDMINPTHRFTATKIR